jgi:hypothetical protein
MNGQIQLKKSITIKKIKNSVGEYIYILKKIITSFLQEVCTRSGIGLRACIRLVPLGAVALALVDVEE